jgi:hypothetical protein
VGVFRVSRFASALLVVLAILAAFDPIRACFAQSGPLDARNALGELAGSAQAQANARTNINVPLVWTTTTRPASPYLDQWGFNSTIGSFEQWSGSAWVTLSSGTGGGPTGGGGTGGTGGATDCDTLDFSQSCNSEYLAMGMP